MGASIAGGRARALVVDDDPAATHALAEILEPAGFEMHLCGSGTDALNAVVNEEFDVVLADLYLPGVGGVELLRIARTFDASSQVIILADYSDAALEAECVRKGAAACIPKPFDARVVRAATEKAVRARRTLLDNRCLDDTIRGTKQTLFKALAARDSYTWRHSTQVMDLSLGFADFLNADTSMMKAIVEAGELHDVGKVGIRDAILNKPGRLSREERATIQAHPVIGKRILDPLGVLEEETAIVYSHHERWDGTGYPQGLRGDEIPLVARTVGIVDCYDAMTNDRPYRRAMKAGEALEIIVRGSGTLFDPALVDAFVDFLRQGGCLASRPGEKAAASVCAEAC